MNTVNEPRARVAHPRGVEAMVPAENTLPAAGRRIRPARSPAASFPEAFKRSFKSEVRMVPGTLVVDGRRIRFAVSDNEQVGGPEGVGSPPVWAVNVHGYFAGGGIYWRESSRLAEALGWRVVNPSLPGFGGSDSLPWEQLSLHALAEQVTAVTEHVGAGPAVVLGHSMGGAVAIDYASEHPERTLGIIYRDGAGTPAWRRRHGLVPTLLAPMAPDVGALVDLLLSVAGDLPDLFMGRMYSTVRSVLPDIRRNVRAMGRTLPVGAMLMTVDQRRQIRALAEREEIPILPVWGIFDRVANPETAREFEALSGSEVQWVPGGHSWMLARPQGQGDVLRHLDRGLEFLRRVEDRWRVLSGIPEPRSATPGADAMREVS